MPAPLALTMGEPGGIGPELAILAWQALRASGPSFVLYADPDLMMARAQSSGLSVTLDVGNHADVDARFQSALPLIPLKATVPNRPGEAHVDGAAAVVEAIERAVIDTSAGRTRAVVTNPIQKSSLYAAGFRHPGHTEFLGALASRIGNQPYTPVMMLASDTLRVVPVTIHIAIAEVPRVLNTDLIVETARIVDRDLRSRFGVPQPRIAVCGLNPHAGESGTMGREDEEVVRPAVERLRALGIDAKGPLPADTLFHARARAGYDVALGMYHDQVLIPIKTLAFDEGVNVTLGLPFVRTSPDHGTALDIAGRGIARATSLIEALRLADRIAS